MMSTEATVLPNVQREMVWAQVRDPSMVPLEAEKRLMLAVLETAVNDFRTYAIVPTGRGRWLFMEVAAWFDSSTTGAFDFEGICEATGLDPDFIRKGLRSWYAMQRLRLRSKPWYERPKSPANARRLGRTRADLRRARGTPVADHRCGAARRRRDGAPGLP